MDDVIAQKHWELLPAARAGGRPRRPRGRRRVVRQFAGAGRRRPARDHRDAQGRRGARHAPADPLLRLDQDRRAHLAHHDRRRRHPEPRRHRHRAAHRLDRLGRHRARRPHLSQLAADGGDDPDPRRVRRRHGHGVQAAAAAVPRPRQDQRRGHGPARRIARRRPHRQGLHGGEARRGRVRARARTACSATSRSR